MSNDTVFSPSFGNRPSRLVGREPVIQGFCRGLQSAPGNRERAVLLLGQRGTGKTVLLWELADRARELGYVVASPTVAAEGMLGRIVEKIQDDGERYVSGHKTSLAGASIGALGFSAGLQFSREVQESKSFQYKLSHLCRELSAQGHGVVVLVDEVQANSPEVRELVIAYQELVGERANVALVMAGLPDAVSATLNDHVLTFLNRARKVELGPLAVGEVDAYFASAFEEAGVRVTPEARAAAARATDGSPYLLQLVGHYVVAYAKADGTVDDAVVVEAVAAARGDFENDVCRTALAPLSDRDEDFLCAMARDEGPSKMSDVAARMEATPDYAQKYRRRLMDAGIIRAPRRGEVEFAVPYLGDYLRRRCLEQA
jgi:type II secretory pathway predicted ATPase ExeA